MKPVHNAAQFIDVTLKDRGFVYKGGTVPKYEGTVNVHGNKIGVRLEVPDFTFVQKPKAYLLDSSQLPTDILAHISNTDGICYASAVGLPLDMYEPGSSILRVLEEIKNTLEASSKTRSLVEVINEYQMYWNTEGSIRILLPKNITLGKHKANYYIASGQNIKFIAVTNNEKLNGYELKNKSSCQVWCIKNPLRPTENFLIPETLSSLKEWLLYQNLEDEMTWAAAENALYDEEMLVFAAPNALVGITIDFPVHIADAIKNRRLRRENLSTTLKNKAHEIKIKHYNGSWCNINDVISRNYLKGDKMREKSIALIGCGTIGSHLAKMLVQSSAGSGNKLTLIDNQSLSIGNIGRHYLGFSEVGKLKVSALKAELERFHPDVYIQALPMNAMDCWNIIRQHDLLIDSTGEWNVQNSLNHNFLYERGEKLKAILHAWIFMNGAGVQSFLNLADEYACFRCLKPKLQSPWRYPPGNENDELNLQPANCGDGDYIPFSVDASTMAASLANKAVLDWANGKPGKRLRTIVVDYERGRFQNPISPHPLSKCSACSEYRRNI